MDSTPSPASSPRFAEILRSEHARVKALFDQILDEKTELQRKRSLFQDLKHELASHSEKEERELYPALVAQLDPASQTGYEIRQQVNRLLREHQDFRDLIGEIDERGDSPEMVELVSDLQEIVMKHVRLEETEILPRLLSLQPAA